MKTSTKTLLASAISAIALACAGGAYAQGAGGSAAGGGTGAGAGGSAGAGGAGGTAGGTHGGAAPSGNTLEQPGIHPGMGRSNDTGGYGSPGTTRHRSGRSTMSPGMHGQSPSGTTGGYSPDQQGQTDHGQGQ
ncbi:MAG: hypothetical protein ACTHKH_21235 [Trinickia sp.]